jgi:cell wall-associated NlpC family hydrolase
MKKSFAVYFFALFFLVLFCSMGHGAAQSNKDWSGDPDEKAPKKHHAGHKHRSAGLRHGRGASGLWKVDDASPVRTAKNTKQDVKQTVTQAAKETSPVQEAAAREEESEYIEYRARKGDTFEKIARRFNVDKEDIIDLNKLGKKRLKPGMTVFIPKGVEPAEDEWERARIVFNNKPMRSWKSEEERGILVKVAKSFAGAPYRYGGDSVKGLDCSAFVKKMYEIFEVELPRSAREQYYAGARVDKSELATGDLVFFKTKRLARYPSHVGIYIGDNKFIHASSVFKRGVKVDQLDGYFARTFMGAVRIMAPPRPGDMTKATYGGLQAVPSLL